MANKIAVARWLATEAHYDQFDKNGDPYIWHPGTVASYVQVLYHPCPDEVVQVAWCHDVIEDTDVDEEILRLHLSEEVVEAIKAITHHPNERLEDYWDRVRSNRWALMVKHADLLHNGDPQRLEKLDPATRKRLEKKYRRALEYLSSDLVRLWNENNRKGTA